jgi:hypothetical protein
MFANQHCLDAFLHQLLASPSHRVDAGIEGCSDLAITPSVADRRGVRLQQNPRPGQLPRGACPSMDQRLETLPLVVAQLHHILLHDNLFRGHDGSPSDLQ